MSAQRRLTVTINFYSLLLFTTICLKEGLVLLDDELELIELDRLRQAVLYSSILDLL